MTEDSVIEQMLHRCIRCGNCKYVFRGYEPSCPSGEYFKFESYFASGRIWLAQAVAKNEFEMDESLVEPLFACTTCGNCEVQCLAPHRGHIVDIIEELRSKVVESIGAHPKHIKFHDNVQATHNPYGAQHHNRSLVEVHNLPDKADTVYFIGCTSNYRETQIRDATISLLKKADVDFTIVDEYCCSSPLLRTGQLDLFNELAHHNVNAIMDAGAKRVVTSCAGCFRTLSRDYPKHRIELPVSVIHSSKLLLQLLAKRDLIPKKLSRRPRVTYHDPCHLGRHMNDYDTPRKVLALLPVELYEMNPTRENAWCCGAGGGAKSAYNEWSVETAAVRIRHAKELDVDYLVTACPFCVRNLNDACDETSPKIIDLAELVDILT
jgi:Fe-S oxidoreductase